MTGAQSAFENEITWRDTKRYAWLLGLMIPILPFLAAGLVEATGLSLFWWLGPIFVFGIVPPLDTLIGKDSANPPDSIVTHLEGGCYYSWCVYLFLPLQLSGLAWACAEWSSGRLSVFGCAGLAVTIGVGGVGIAAADEFGSKSERVERWLSKVSSLKRHTVTSSSSITAAITCESLRPKIPPHRDWAKASGRSCRGASQARYEAHGISRRAGCGAKENCRSRCRTTS